MRLPPTHTMTVEGSPPSEPMYWTAICTCGLAGTPSSSPAEARRQYETKHPTTTPNVWTLYNPRTPIGQSCNRTADTLGGILAHHQTWESAGLRPMHYYLTRPNGTGFQVTPEYLVDMAIDATAAANDAKADG